MSQPGDTIQNKFIQKLIKAIKTNKNKFKLNLISERKKIIIQIYQNTISSGLPSLTLSIFLVWSKLKKSAQQVP